MNTLKIWDNPLVVRSVRTRLRLPLLLSWTLITVVASAFLYIVIYANAAKQESISEAEAARDAILPLLIMQGLILMVLGTGAVAGGIARERTYRLLDYQRLTPMTPSAKIVGLLIGLPIREYFMFAVSLPFVVYAAVKGGLPLWVLAQFYAVFIGSAVVYHTTGLAAGMVVGKPWQAGTLSQGLVVVLYLLLPQISHFGFTFFEYLTARPAFYGMINEFLLPDSISAEVRERLADFRYQSVAFYGFELSPLLFSLAVQGFAFMSLYVIIYRKWQSQARLPFSKAYALLFFALVQLFLVGSVLPFLTSDDLFAKLTEVAQRRDPVRDPGRSLVLAILMVTLSVSGCAAMLTVYLCTPSWYQSLAGLRRAKRQGRARLRSTDDAASGLPVAIACVLMSWLGFIAVHRAAVLADRVPYDNGLGDLLLPMVFFAAVLIVVQQVIEQLSERAFVMVLFVCWLIPVLVGIIVASAGGNVAAGLYIALPFPGVALLFSSVLIMSDASTPLPYDVLPATVARHDVGLVVVSVCVYACAAAIMLALAWWRARRLQQQASLTPRDSPQPLPSG